MKTKPPMRLHTAPARAGSGRSADAWLLGLALAATAMQCTPLRAEVYDDFQSATRSETLWTHTTWYGVGTQLVTSGQARIDITPDSNHGFSFLQSVRQWTLQEGRTLEFRVDLLSSNGDGAVTFFGFNAGDGGYRLMVDEDTFTCHKRGGTQFFFVTNGAPVKTSNVKLVVSMTGTKSSVLLKFKILDNDNAGAVIFERQFLDTPGQDPMQIGPEDPPGNYLGASGYFYLGLYRDNAGTVDPDVTLPHLARGEVVFDNAEVLEYDVPLLQVAKSVLLSWSANTEEERIVVGSDSLASSAVWTPWPEPIFKRFGQMCMAVPATASQQFFKTVPGRQFVDDFSDAWGPFTNRNTWTPFFQEAGEDWFVTNGVLQMIITPTPLAGFGLAPLGTNAAARLRDLCASVDIVDWAPSGSNSSDFALGGRARSISPTYVQAYMGFLTLNADGVPGRVRPWISTPSGATYGTAFDLQQFPLPYRLQFSVVGTQISLRVLNPATGQLIKSVSSSSSTLPDGFAGPWLQGGVNAGDSNRISLDNFFVSGMKP